MEITNLSQAQYPEFLALYEESFPEAQRRPYRGAEDFARFAAEHHKFHALAAFDEGKFVGFLNYWRFNGFTYIEHLAVKPESRGKGIGTALVEYLIKTVSQNLLLEVEPPLTNEARSRIAFYQGLGFTLNNHFMYTQPPYTRFGENVSMRLMTHGDVTVNDYGDLKELLAEVYNTAFTA